MDDKLKDFISKQPIDVLYKTQVLDDKVHLPGKVDKVEFDKKFQEEINSSEFTTEKAIHVASLHTQEAFKTASNILNSKLRFTK